ncbi:MAG: GGDEF domain-containing protein [Desulfuromonadales bacterium]|nr:GGDEF domain-containing protein [Desulfuromonadales bacterium]
MIQPNSALLLIMSLSSAVQLVSAVMAIRLIRPSGVFTAWLLLACGFIIQGVRRIFSLFEVLSGHLHGDMIVEILGLAISLLMLCGILKFRPLFDEISRSHQALMEKQTKLTNANRELEEAQRCLRKANLNLSKLARIDALTGVGNRRDFDQILTNLWKGACRNKKSLAILMIDIDHFKSYNDTYGHPRGDDCLRKVAHTIQQSCLRPEDFVFRYGGEEFVGLLPETTLSDAHHVAERIRVSLQQQKIPHAGSPSGKMVTLSIGVCSMQPDSLTNEQILIDCADRRMYHAKHCGRNQVCSYDPDE